MRVSRIIKRGLQLAIVVPLGLHGAGQWSDVREDEVQEVSLPYEAANRLFKKIATQKDFRRPHYLWGALHGVNLAKAVGIEKVSLIEFGVAGGNGLTALETIAERLESFRCQH
jgi:hypothetical protein